MATSARTRQAAYAALARRAHTVEELRRKLERKGFEPAEVEETLDDLLRLRLLDDRAVAARHAEQRAEEGRRGPLRVRAELRARGITAEQADEALAAAFPPEDDDERLRRAAERLTGDGPMPADPAARERLARRLLRAGFPAGAVRRLIERGGDVPMRCEDLDDDIP
jgi:regulatory protein